MKRPTQSHHALTTADGSALDREDCELILRALDLLDRHTQDELANKQQAAMINMRSRLLIVRAKVQAMRGVS